ncbi:MAG TPA: methyltransferase domain-containing protein [Gemmatimonadaceae bacterium]|jgi:SAM-dependent methyltransferase|nr:methyltransferase domain-containing protein [Gemmatimonadaceae bacterium]
MPPRRRDREILDDPTISPALRERSLRDVRRSNVVFGGRRAVLAVLGGLLPGLAPRCTLLDVGTGLADIPVAARELATRAGVSLDAFGVDAAASLAAAARPLLAGSACADVRRLPFGDASVDVVTCSQLLHHFADEEVPAVLRELNRVARRHVIVSELRRSWLAACGFWLAAWPLGFHRITRHDGFVSVRRGFTAEELAHHVLDATDRRPRVRRHLGFRLTATWETGPA